MSDRRITMGDGFRFAAGVWLFTLALMLAGVPLWVGLFGAALGLGKWEGDSPAQQPALWQPDRPR